MELRSKDLHLFCHRRVVCNRHPAEPVTGFCAFCLRERLSGIDPDANIEVPSTRRVGEFRRSKSFSTSISTTYLGAVVDQQHRRSCNVRTRSSLNDLLNREDGKRKESFTHPKFKGLGFDLGIEIDEELLVDVENLRACSGKEEFKTMKEFIDLEWKGSAQNKKENKYHGIVSKNIRGVASAFGKKLNRWHLKHKPTAALNDKVMKTTKMEKNNFVLGNVDCRGSLREQVSCRKSCDMYGRCSVDSAMQILPDVQELCNGARASWDGCSIQNRNHHPDLDPKNENNVTRGRRDTVLECRNDESFEYPSSQRRLSLKNGEVKSLWNVEVSPKAVSLLNGAKLLVTEKELRDSNWYAVKTSSNTGDSAPISSTLNAAANREGKKNSKRLQLLDSLRNIGNMFPRKTGYAETANFNQSDCKNQKNGRRCPLNAADSSEMEKHDHKKVPTFRNIENGLLRFHFTPLWNHGKNFSGKKRDVNS